MRQKCLLVPCMTGTEGPVMVLSTVRRIGILLNHGRNSCRAASLKPGATEGSTSMIIHLIFSMQNRVDMLW